MPEHRTGYRGRILTVRATTSTLTWSIAGEKSEWAPDVRAEVYFVREDELEGWELEQKGTLPIPAGLWQRQKTGTFLVTAPILGQGAPFRIPPGYYYIVIVWPQGSAATAKTVAIPGGGDGEPLSPEELGCIASRRPSAEFERKDTRARVRFLDLVTLEQEKWRWLYVGPPKKPPVGPPPPPYPKGIKRQDKVDPFPDLQSAIPTLVADIRNARHNIWIAWWALEDDFPTTFGGKGLPKSFLRDEIKAALKANPQLHVYILIWNLNGGKWNMGLFPPGPPGIPPVPKIAHPKITYPTHSKWCTKASANRLHFAYQSNWIRGSHHQKFLLCDLNSSEGAVLWCRGWDGLITYWDLHKHNDPDPYLDVNGKDHQPWHDTAVRVVSKKTSRAFEMEFRRRWPSATARPTRPIPPFPLPPFPPLAFRPNPVGTTVTVPKIHVERTRPGPQETWYNATIPKVNEGLYLENQYFCDRGITSAVIGRYLQAELGIKPIHGVINICHPDIMSPFILQPPSRDNIAHVRAFTARVISLRIAAGIKQLKRPPGGWATVSVTPPWIGSLSPFSPFFLWSALSSLLGKFFHVKVTWPGGGASGDMVRAISGIVCLTMVTPSVKVARVFRPIYLHSKFAVMDGQYMLGSSNIGEQSFFFDSEADVNVPDAKETSRAVDKFFPALVGGGGGANLSTWLNRMSNLAKANYDMEKGLRPWAPVGLLTEFPYE